MGVKRVRIIGDPVLRQKSSPIETVTEEIGTLALSMIETMHEYRGLGLAANQIGETKRIAVFDLKALGVGKKNLVLINPEITYFEGAYIEEEGCLSIPGLYAELMRPSYVEVRALSLQNKKIKDIEISAEELYARALLHEIDHLNGVLFIDRIEERKRRLLLAEWKQKHREF